MIHEEIQSSLFQFSYKLCKYTHTQKKGKKTAPSVARLRRLWHVRRGCFCQEVLFFCCRYGNVSLNAARACQCCVNFVSVVKQWPGRGADTDKSCHTKQRRRALELSEATKTTTAPWQRSARLWSEVRRQENKRSYQSLVDRLATIGGRVPICIISWHRLYFFYRK